MRFNLKTTMLAFAALFALTAAGCSGASSDGTSGSSDEAGSLVGDALEKLESGNLASFSVRVQGASEDAADTEDGTTTITMDGSAQCDSSVSSMTASVIMGGDGSASGTDREVYVKRDDDGTMHLYNYRNGAWIVTEADEDSMGLTSAEVILSSDASWSLKDGTQSADGADAYCATATISGQEALKILNSANVLPVREMLWGDDSLMDESKISITADCYFSTDGHTLIKIDCDCGSSLMDAVSENTESLSSLTLEFCLDAFSYSEEAGPEIPAEALEAGSMVSVGETSASGESESYSDTADYLEKAEQINEADKMMLNQGTASAVTIGLPDGYSATFASDSSATLQSADKLSTIGYNLLDKAYNTEAGLKSTYEAYISFMDEEGGYSNIIQSEPQMTVASGMTFTYVTLAYDSPDGTHHTDYYAWTDLDASSWLYITYGDSNATESGMNIDSVLTTALGNLVMG